MNKFFAAVISAAALSGFLAADEMEFKLNKASDWSKHHAVTWIGEKKDVIQAKGGAFLMSTRLFDVDVAKKYTLKAEAKLISGGPAPTYVGFLPHTKDGRPIHCETVNILTGSETTVAAGAEKGATKLILKATPQWKRRGVVAIALNAKKDYSDLPNFNILLCKSYGIVKDTVEVTLRKPLAADIAAGTPVRGHVSGGYMYTAGFRQLADGQSFEFKGSARGRLKTSTGRTSWGPGAEKARIVLLINWGKRDAVAQIKNVELKIEK